MLFYFLQMGGSAYNNQFMAHAGPRGPPGMAQGGMGPGPARAPPSMGPMYGPGGPAQRMAQHPNYGPGPQQGPLRPAQGLKRPYNSEVGSWKSLLVFNNIILYNSLTDWILKHFL